LTETILCVKDNLLSLVPVERIIENPEARQKVEAHCPWFIPRPHAEGDESFRQVIEHDGKFASYKRIAGDPRLVGQFAIGIGGHVNSSDIRHEHRNDDKKIIDVYATIAQGTIREVFEETDGVSCSRQSKRRIGVIYSDHGPVERVHIGLVEIWKLDHADVSLREQGKKELDWHTVEDLTALPLEHWSFLCVQWLRKNWSCIRPASER
jgi:predicted NUDIX family phosphoesterase